MGKRIITTENLEEDVKIENHLRPQLLSDYIGQEKAKQTLKIYIEAAKSRKESLDHVLFYGPPGLGKTTLAGIIANEMNVNLKVTSGPAIEKPREIAAILNNLQEGDVLFVDEIHRLNRQVEEVLYPAMEDYAIDIMFGKGISKEGDILDLAVKENIVEKSGAWFAYDGSKIGQGRENAKQYLLSHPAICEEIEAQVRVKYNLPGAEEAEALAREADKKEEELAGSILPEGTEEELMAGEAEEE